MTPSRRDFVAMLLGAPLAAACGSGKPALPPGIVMDTGRVAGHRAVRDLATAPMPTLVRTHRVIIVGAGVAGLSAAWELLQRGVTDVVVLELDTVAGGTARGGTGDVTPYPWGAHYIVAPTKEQTDLITLLREMNAIEGESPDGTPIVSEELRCRELEERVLAHGRWYEGLYLSAGSNVDDQRQYQAFQTEILRLSALRDSSGRRIFALPRSSAGAPGDLAALDGITFAAWLDQRRFTSERLRWLCDYACRDDYGLRATDTSAFAGLLYFAARQHAGPQDSIAPRGRSATLTAVSPPSIDYQSVITWPDGNAALVRHLARGVTVHTGYAIAQANPDGTLVALGPDGAIGFRAERVILAVPGFIADHLVPSRARVPADYGAWAVANLHLRARPRERRGAPPAWDSVIRDSPSLGYVSATHQRGRDRGPTVFTWFYPFTNDGPTARRSVEGAGYAEWAEVALADLSRAHEDIRSHVERIEVAFWGHGMIRPRPGTMLSPARAVRIAPVGKLHFAHTDLSGIALFEEAFDHGLRAAREVAAALA